MGLEAANLKAISRIQPTRTKTFPNYPAQVVLYQIYVNNFWASNHYFSSFLNVISYAHMGKIEWLFELT